jgi:hypothetical protein
MNSEAERLIQSGLIQSFVKQRGGQWNHQEWLGFLASVRSAGYHILSDDEIGLLLEQEKSRMNPPADKPEDTRDCECKNCHGRFRWGDLYRYTWHNVNYPVNSPYITNYEAGFCPSCGRALIRYISGQTREYVATEWAYVYSPFPSIMLGWDNHNSPLYSAYMANPDLLAFDNRDALDMKSILASAQPHNAGGSQLQEERIDEIVRAILSNSPDKFAAIGNPTSSEWIMVFSMETENRFSGWITSMQMLELILGRFRDLGDPELVGTYLIILRNLRLPAEDWPKIGTLLGRTALALGAVVPARKYLLPNALNKNYDWVQRLHLLACLAEMGIQEVRESISAWINPETNVSWVYTVLRNALDTLQRAQK